MDVHLEIVMYIFYENDRISHFVLFEYLRTREKLTSFPFLLFENFLLLKPN